MNINDLLQIDLGGAVSVFNEPFTYVGHAVIELDGGQSLRWHYGDEGAMLSISAEEEELILFHEIDEELEADGEMILYQGKEYEFNYEDAGNITEIEGDSVTEEEDRYMFSDYQAAGGDRIRVIKNANTGEEQMYAGMIVSEDDLSQM